jgi:hypothetical protein
MCAMQETALTYLRQLGPESKARVTDYFVAEVEEMSLLAGRLIETLQNYHRRNALHDPESPKQVAFGLMTKGANTLMAAFELSLSGYLWEPSILSRSALEGFATAWDLVHNGSRFQLWKTKRKFDSSDSITNVKEAIDEIGKLYGHLSNFSVHTNPLNSSPSMVMVEDQPKFQLFGLVTPGRESIRRTEVLWSLFVTYVCLQLTELVFYQYATELETIEEIPGKNMVRTRVSERHKKMVEAMKAHLAQLATDGGASF